MRYEYYPSGVCPMKIEFDIEDNIISNIRFTGGCNGNLKILSKLVDNWTVEEIEEKLSGNTCGYKDTSCADQLAKAVRKAYDEIV